MTSVPTKGINVDGEVLACMDERWEFFYTWYRKFAIGRGIVTSPMQILRLRDEDDWIKGTIFDHELKKETGEVYVLGAAGTIALCSNVPTGPFAAVPLERFALYSECDMSQGTLEVTM